jgi:hypothetical protein
MKLIIIYGPPATGKFTTARELENLTGYKLFHNHLTVDLAKSVFDFGTEPFFNYCDKLRMDTFEIAAKENIAGMIFTFCYSDPHDNEFIRRAIEIVEKYHGEVKFVRLYCTKEQLTDRVIRESRKQFQKIRTVSELDDILAKYNLFAAIPFVDSLQIDNTDLPPATVADQIRIYFEL